MSSWLFFSIKSQLRQTVGFQVSCWRDVTTECSGHTAPVFILCSYLLRSSGPLSSTFCQVSFHFKFVVLKFACSSCLIHVYWLLLHGSCLTGLWLVGQRHVGVSRRSQDIADRSHFSHASCSSVQSHILSFGQVLNIWATYFPSK